MPASLKPLIREINNNFCNTMFARYMEGEWGIHVGFYTEPLYYVSWQKGVADWQLSYDCEGKLCTEARKFQQILSSGSTGFSIETLPVVAIPLTCDVFPPMNSYPLPCPPKWIGNGDSLL